MNQSFRFAPFWQTEAEIWVPLVLDTRRTDRGGRSLRLFARLKDGVTLEQARAELRTLTSRLAAAYPETDRGLTTGAVPLTEKASGPARPLVLAIFGLSLAVLLIASANVASLTLARECSRVDASLPSARRSARDAPGWRGCWSPRACSSARSAPLAGSRLRGSASKV